MRLVLSVPYPSTIRVQGVPRDWTVTQLRSYLIDQGESADPRVKSLAPEIDGQTSTATVTKTDDLKKVKSGRKRKITLPKVDHNARSKHLILDVDFFGVTTLFYPPDIDHQIDVLAISGLGDRAFQSFQEKGTNYMWLRDALPYDLTSGKSDKPMARVMICGHEIGKERNSDNRVLLASTSLRNMLLGLAASPRTRPLILIANKLSVPIIKEALISSSRSDKKEDKQSLKAICGIALFGLPHGGESGIELYSRVPEIAGTGIRADVERILSQYQGLQGQELGDASGVDGDANTIIFDEESNLFFLRRAVPGSLVNNDREGCNRLIELARRATTYQHSNIQIESSAPTDGDSGYALASHIEKTAPVGSIFQDCSNVPHLTQLQYKAGDHERDSGYTSAPRIATSAPSESVPQDHTSKPPLAQNQSESDDASAEMQSLATDDEDIGSQVSNETTSEGMTGKAFIRVFLAEEPNFRALCEMALPKLGKDRFVENMRRLLKSFQISLSEEAEDEAEKAVARLLRSRRGRQRISKQLAAYMHHDNDTWETERDNSAIPPAAKDQLENWLSQLACDTLLERAAIIEQEMDSRDVDEYSSTTSSDDSSKSDKFPFTSDLEAFLRDSISFRRLLNEFKLMFLPSTLRHVLSSIPLKLIWVSREQDLSFPNTTKAWVEDRTQIQWNWWPLAQRKRTLQDGEARVFWKCTCGDELWKEVSVEHCELVEQILAVSDERPKHTHWCRPKGGFTLFIRWLRRILGERRRAPASARSTAAQRYTPPGNLVQSPAPQGNAARSAGVPASSRPQDSQTASIQTERQTGIPLTEPVSWVLFGVRAASRKLAPSEVSLNKQPTDCTFFRELRRCYELHRGRLRLWFSIWRLQYCHGVKFKRLTLKHMVRVSKGLPTDQEYEYNPRNPPVSSREPLIEAHTFESFFYACSEGCIWRHLPWHECFFIPLENNEEVEKVPKRGRSFEKDTTSPIWGIETHFEASAAYVAAYHLVMLAGPFTFWWMWLDSHPDDLQTAAVPLGLVLTGLSLFWCSIGLLPSLRGHD